MVPEQRGVAASALLSFIDALESRVDSVHGLTILRGGAVIADGAWHPYRRDRPHELFSLSKSFTCMAVGLALDEGLFGLDDAVVALLPEDSPTDPSARLRALTVRHLLTMTTGHATESLEHHSRRDEANWARYILAKPLEFDPGTHFTYNSGASYLLSAIVQRATGRRVLDYLGDSVLAPLGIADATWEQCPRGIDAGGWGLALRTSDVARFGQLVLDDGRWLGRQLVPEQWIRAATRAQVANGDAEAHDDWQQGYGYQFWMCRHGAFRGDGAFGQFCIILPEKDAVIAMTGGLVDMQEVLDLVWQELLPAFDTSAPDHSAGSGELERRLAALELAPAPGHRVHAPSDRLGVRFELSSNDQNFESLQLDANPATATAEASTLLTLWVGGARHVIPIGHAAWLPGKLPAPGGERRAVSSQGGWFDDDSFGADLWLTDGPYRYRLLLRFDGSRVELSVDANVAFESTRVARATGTAFDGAS